MKILLVVVTLLIIFVSVFFLAIDADTRAKNRKRKEIFNPKIYMPEPQIVSVVDEVSMATSRAPGVVNRCDAGPVLIDHKGRVQLLNMDSFIRKYYSDEILTEYRARYESEPLSIADRYQIEDIIYKNESDSFRL